MTRKMNCSLAAIAVATTSLALPSGAALAQETETASDENSGVIVVTARKREEDLLKTPIAITAFTSEAIEAKGITSINDLVENTPGINVSNISSGRNDRSFQQISMRGFTPSIPTSTLTATFINGVPVSSATAVNAVGDPARIEILKGPQSAYFGRNTFAGAVNVVTKAPADTFGGSIKASGGSRSSYDLALSLEGPIIEDVLSFRATGRAWGTDGSYDNAANPGQTLGDRQTRTGTLQLDFTPTDSLKIAGFGLYSEDKDGPSAQGMLSAYEIRSDNGALNIPFNSGSNAGDILVPSLSNCNLVGLSAGISATETAVTRPYICGAAPALPKGFSPAQNTTEDSLLAGILNNYDQRITSPSTGVQGYGLVRRFYHLNLTVDYEVGDTGITLSSLTGYNNEIYSQLADLDNFDSDSIANGAAAFIPGARTTYSFPFLVERANRDFSQEFRASYDDGGPLQAMLGVSYLNAYSENDLVSVFAEEQFLAPRSDGSLGPPGKAVTKSIFGGVSYEVIEGLKISAEGRYQQDKIFAYAGGRGLTVASDNLFGLPGGTFGPTEQFFSKKYNNFQPRIIVNYDITPDIMIYASWAKAANVALSSFNTSFLSGSAGEVAAAASIGLEVVTEPEKLTNYEAGLKGSFLDGAVLASFAVYKADWNGQYNNRSTVFNDTSVNPPVPSIISGLANSGDVNLWGTELDLLINPVEGVTITAAGAINDSSIQSFADPSISRLTGSIDDDFIGNQLQLASKYSGTLGVEFYGDIENWDDAGWFIRTNLNYKSKQFVDAANLTWIKSRSVVNGRIGFTKGDLSLELFANNLLNNTRYTSIAQNVILTPDFSLTGANSYLNVGLPDKRTIGIKAGLKF
ncbi:TonB-dependent receptor [Parasphingorhabdus sp.]|uniref:TonB-dependent receptor n=1 Tax=Parasphingorhabdus sp. TaxID=2709688 RepID=UPI003267D284